MTGPQRRRARLVAMVASLLRFAPIVGEAQRAARVRHIGVLLHDLRDAERV